MSLLQKCVLAIIVTYGWVYLMAIFVTLQVNPLDWTESGRLGYVWFTTVSAWFMALVVVATHRKT